MPSVYGTPLRSPRCTIFGLSANNGQTSILARDGYDVNDPISGHLPLILDVLRNARLFCGRQAEA
jgi:hypothetical protein